MFKRAMCIGMFLLSDLTLARPSTEPSFYTELDALYFASPGDFDSEQTMGLTFGYRLKPDSAIEFEWQVNGLDSNKPGFEVDADLFTYLVGYKHTMIDWKKTQLFVGAGIGYSRAEFFTSPTTSDEQDLTIGFARIGADFDLSDSIYVSTELRYQYTPNISKGGQRYEIGGAAVAGFSAGYRF